MRERRMTPYNDVSMLELRRFSVEYPAFTLEPVDVSIRAGERVAVVGANGAGKSTMLRAIGGRLLNYLGDIRVNGVEMRKQLPKIREHIGYLPEILLGYGWMTIAQHLDFLTNFFPTWDTDYAARLVERLALPLEAKLGTLSKGMKVKLSFVAAEAYRPATLLLDEPTSGLDPMVRREVIDVIRERVPKGGDRLLLFSTHILEDVEWIADRVLILSRGNLIADVGIAELRHQGPDIPLSEILYSILSDAKRQTSPSAHSD
jgi:ABC-2 type transport system ATP-binding protein